MTYMTNDQWAIRKWYKDGYIKFLITTIAKASLDDGDYFLYIDGAGNKYYVWFDQVGDESNDPAPNGYTKVTVDISGISTAQEIAAALATALDALTYTSATYLDTIVTVSNADNEEDSSITDINTNMTFALSSNCYAAKNDGPPASTLTRYREDAYALINTEIDGASDLDTEFLQNQEYRIVELMIDEEQGRSTEEGRPMYIPRDYLFQRDRDKLSNSGDTFTRGTGQ
ncbi:MAG: hypothetical protein ACTSUK_04480 [Promethearchaeota archaeon]